MLLVSRLRGVESKGRAPNRGPGGRGAGRRRELAPDIQEEILALPLIEPKREPIREP